jgi:hypothetical protein
MKFAVAVLVTSLLLGTGERQDKPKATSIRAQVDVELETNPSSTFWSHASPIYAEVDPNGRKLPDYRTEIRSRWTAKYLYFFFVCPYKELYLKPNPDPQHETFQLWNWNVAEVFIGADFKDIERYKEFEISPHNEWIDLDIDLHNPHHEQGWTWNSGFEHVTRIDEAHRTWYAAMRIPFAALDTRAPSAGTIFRANFYRTDGPPQRSQEITWQPTMSKTFHVPERFGLLQLSNQ